jgi:hypothetical protein
MATKAAIKTTNAKNRIARDFLFESRSILGPFL